MPKCWTEYADQNMDKFIETGEGQYLNKFVAKFFCEACQGHCTSCIAHSSTKLYPHLPLDPKDISSRGCVILYCLNKHFNGAHFYFEHNGVGRMSRLACKLTDYKGAALNEADFLFEFVPLWETMKGDKDA